MSTEINGVIVFAAISKEPSAFGLMEAQINQLAAQFLTTQIKEKNSKLEHLKSILKAVGAENFKLALDGLTARDAATVSKRIDPKHPEVKSTDERWHRRHLAELAEGSCSPVVAQVKSTRVPRAEQPPSSGDAKTGAPLKSKALKPRARKKADAA